MTPIVIMMENFKEKTFAFIKKIPKGKVVSYGQVAAFIGSPRAARQVGGVLRTLDSDTDVPWWRVINNKGYISIRGNEIGSKDLQKQLLQRDGVEVSKDYVVDMKKYRYNIL